MCIKCAKLFQSVFYLIIEQNNIEMHTDVCDVHCQHNSISIKPGWEVWYIFIFYYIKKIYIWNKKDLLIFSPGILITKKCEGSI